MKKLFLLFYELILLGEYLDFLDNIGVGAGVGADWKTLQKATVFQLCSYKTKVIKQLNTRD